MRGSSDRALVLHLQQLLSHCGAPEVVGSAIALSTVRDPGEGGGSVLERKIRVVLSTESEFDLLFVHRDADGAGHEARTREIVEASSHAGLNVDQVSVIPVRSTEAWIVLDEDAIRRVAGYPRGRQPLDLPPPSRIEHVSDSEGNSEDCSCCGLWPPGASTQEVPIKVWTARRILLEQLPVGGVLNEVPAWVRLKQAVSVFVAQPAPTQFQ